jgi:hypothetical protein
MFVHPHVTFFMHGMLCSSAGIRPLVETSVYRPIR